MRFLFLASAFAALAAIGAACNAPTEHINAYTLEACTPNGKTFQPKPKKHTNDKCQGTSNGDNCDDLSSGKVDCIGDGNSGQGDDKKHNCMFPQPGCDDQGCCDPDVVDDPGDDGDNPDPSPSPSPSPDPSPSPSPDPTSPTIT